MFKILPPCLVLIILLNSIVLADQVVMTNGDRLTGKIIKKDGDSIVLETEAVGIVKIRWTAVERIVSDEPLSLTLDDGKILQGKIQFEENKLNIITSEKEKVTIEKTAVKTVRTPKEQSEYEAEQKRLAASRITDFWTGSVDAGFSLTTGNAKTQTFTGGLRGIRETVKNKFTVYANALQVKNSTSGAKVVTAQSVWTGARYDMNINRKWFAYGSGDFEYNKPQKLNLRSVLGSGFGYHAISKDKTNFDLLGGISNNFESFSTGLKRNSAEASFGEELKHKLNLRVKLNQRFVIYPNLSRMGQFRALYDSTIQTDINSWLGMYLTVGNRYNSQPVSLTKKNDFLLSTGLRVSFGKGKRK